MSNNIIAPFHKIYDEIVTEYEKNNTDVEKWKLISAKMNENNDVFVQMFQFLKKQKLEKLNYISKLEKISSGNDMELVRSIMSGLHFIIYNLCSKEGNYYFAL